jgi:membrane protease YdiL (CAAX protease family)
LLPSIVLSLLAQAIRSVLVPGDPGPDIKANSVLLFGMLVFVGPLLESIIMGGVLLALVRWLRPTHAVVVSAILWGAAHSLSSPLWGLVVWWPFLVFSIVFLTWRDRGYWPGVGMATLVHGLQNATAGIALLAVTL